MEGGDPLSGSSPWIGPCKRAQDEHESPCIMLSNKEVPSEFLTPGVSPEEIPEKPSAKKQRRFRLEMEVSSGSGDHPCQRLSLPLSENSEGVTVRFAISGESESETEAAESCAPEGIALPQAAPGRLGELGLSHGDMTDLHDLWCRGELTLQTIAQDHGREAADLLRGMWETNLPSQAGGRQGEDDETALLTLQVSMLMATRIGWGVAMEHEDPTMAILREHLLRQRGEGTTIREQSSTLYSIIQNRQVPAYMDEFPDLMHELGLEVDVNLHARCLPGPTPFYTWVEEELWQLFQDRFEATMGFETEQVRQHRGIATMPPNELQEWRSWAGLIDVQATRRRSRSPRREGGTRRQSSTTTARQQEERVEQQEGSDFSSLMHSYGGSRGSGHNDRRRRTRRRNTGPDRGRSREHRGPIPSNREQRVRERVTRETRTLAPRECSGWTTSNEGLGTDGAPSTRPPLRRNTTEMEIVQATGKWLQIMGMRRRGEEQLEPSNALTRQMQADARSALRPMSDRDLQTMVNALMRLMGMMYIELARILISAQDERRRAQEEEVEVEVDLDEEDDESIYMQRFMEPRPAQWGKMLMELVALAEDATNNGLLMALKRRISSSLYLQTAKGAQLQAALVAATGVAKDDAESCDTSDNDYGRAEDWWKRLKQHMDLSDPGEGGASSQEPMRVPHLPAGEYTDEQVQCWEAERQGLLREQAAELEDQLKYEKEEAEALEQDERRWSSMLPVPTETGNNGWCSIRRRCPKEDG